MNDTFERKVITPAEREARKVFKQVDAAKAMTEHERAQKAFHDVQALRLLSNPNVRRLFRPATIPAGGWRGKWTFAPNYCFGTIRMQRSSSI